MKNISSNLIRTVLDFILPSPCQVCGSYHSFHPSWPVCETCLSTIRRVPSGCSRCGRPHWRENIQFLVDDFLCGDCLKEKRPFIDEARSAIIYEGVAKQLVRLYKYKNRIHLIKIFSPIILETLNIWGPVGECDFIVPVPLHTRKHRQRTFNPSLLLADVIARDFNIPVAEHSLVRPVPGIKQAGLNKRERVHAVKGVFAVREDNVIRGKRILLVDDVFTTGATARECAKMLTKSGAESVYVFTLARTVK